MLSGEEILKEIEEGNIKIEPFNPKLVNPNSYNLTLGNELLIYTDDVLDASKQNSYKKIKIPEEGYILAPNTLYLAQTNETVGSDKFIQQLSGRSSIGRIGLSVHISGGFSSIGYKGKWTLNITCIRPTVIKPNMEICQVWFYPIVGEVKNIYQGKYQNNIELDGSKSYMDFIKQ